MASRKTIVQEIYKLSIFYPYPERGDVELDVLADMWVEDLKEISDRLLIEKISEHRKSSRFFPTTSDILSAQVVVPIHSGQVELPQHPSNLTDADLERNKKNVDRILKLLNEKMAV